MKTLESRLNLVMWLGIVVAAIGGITGTMWMVYVGAVVIVVPALWRLYLHRQKQNATLNDQ